MIENRDISEVLRQLRAQLNLTQEELAKRLKVSFTTLNRWENSKTIPRGTAKKAIFKLIEEMQLDLEQSPDLDEQPGLGHSRGRKRVSREDVLSIKAMEQILWRVACSIHGEIDAPKYKDYILPLIFLKRLSDVFDDEVERVAESFGDYDTAMEQIENDHSLVRFYLPLPARWQVISGRETYKWPNSHKPKTIGEQLTRTMRHIVKENSELSGVIDRIDYNETRGGEREVSDTALSDIIEQLSNPYYRLGIRDVEPDFLGRAYEYLLRKFAEGQGQSAGEFFTPTEVGWLIAHIVRPQQGETVYDYACGSAGLLIKCELYLRKRENKVNRPLKLFGQELTGSTYAIAKMNTIIHDMKCEIMRGDSMMNPKFRTKEGGLQKFDIIVANPMWNQATNSAIYKEDHFDRFNSHGGITTGKADWAWLQHTIASLKPNGHAAVVIDTGALTRGSDSKGEDKEKAIRKWFIENDLIESIVLLPDNLFYNTPAAGVIIFLNRAKMAKRKGKIILINAGLEFRKGRPKNYLPEKSIKKISDTFIKGKNIERFARVITTKEAVKNDYNLSPSRYVNTTEKVVYRPIPEIWSELKILEKEAKKADRVMGKALAQFKESKA